jgi:hypothetical protein
VIKSGGIVRVRDRAHRAPAGLASSPGWVPYPSATSEPSKISADLAVPVSCWPKSAERPETLIGRDRLGDRQEAAGIVFEDTASALFGVEGLRVTDARAGPDGVLEVWAVTDYLQGA